LSDDVVKKLVKQLDPVTEQTIRSVYEAANSLSIDVLLCGATARMLVLEHVYGCHPDRQTKDVDFAFAVNDWSQHEKLVQCLVATGLWQRGQRQHQLLSLLKNYVYPLDLVPYGAIADEQGSIRWPPKQEFEMSVLGFAEANSYAMRVAVAQDLVIDVVDVVSIVMLKLIAWRDRRLDPEPRRKHAQDFVLILRRYGEFKFNEDRVYSEVPMVFDRADADVCLVGAWLLGTDVGRRAEALTQDRLRSVFTVRHHLLSDMQATNFFASPESAEALLSYFVEGFQSI
jgi:predicted nucleotidyltransferase